MLAIFDPKKPISVHTDASDYAVGAVMVPRNPSQCIPTTNLQSTWIHRSIRCVVTSTRLRAVLVDDQWQRFPSYCVHPWVVEGRISGRQVLCADLRDGERLCVPDIPEVKAMLMKWYHDDPVAGHQGVERTYQLARETLYWPGMFKAVKHYVDSCHECATHKDRTTLPGGLLQPLPVPERPWDAIAMDLITQLPKTKLGHDAIVVFVDRFSKQAVFVPAHLYVGRSRRLGHAPD